MLETNGAHSVTSRSHTNLPAASQESLVPLSQLQQSTPAEPRHSDHLPPNIITQLSFPKSGSPQKRCQNTNNVSLPVSDAPAINSVLSVFLTDGLSGDANLIPPPTVVDEQLHALNTIFHLQAAKHDPSSLEGISSLLINLDPCAFAVGTKSNPNILSQSAMLNDNHKFVMAQQAEITGLEDADVFEFHSIDELQSLPAGMHLLNAIWSYHRKCKPNGKIPHR